MCSSELRPQVRQECGLQRRRADVAELALEDERAAHRHGMRAKQRELGTAQVSPDAPFMHERQDHTRY